MCFLYKAAAAGAREKAQYGVYSTHVVYRQQRTSKATHQHAKTGYLAYVNRWRCFFFARVAFLMLDGCFKVVVCKKQ